MNDSTHSPLPEVVIADEGLFQQALHTALQLVEGQLGEQPEQVCEEKHEDPARNKSDSDEAEGISKDIPTTADALATEPTWKSLQPRAQTMSTTAGSEQKGAPSAQISHLELEAVQNPLASAGTALASPSSVSAEPPTPFGAAAKGSPSSSPQAGSGYGYRHTPPRSTYDTYRLDKKLGPDTDERLVYFQKRVDVLNTEIETALRHVARDLPLMEADIKAWKQLNDQVPAAEVEYAIKAFRRLIDEVHANKFTRETTANPIPVSTEGFKLPESFHVDPDQVGGWSATTKPKFWFRFFEALFGFLACILMSQVPHIDEPMVHASSIFDEQCSSLEVIEGTFLWWPYQLVLVVGACTCLYGIFMVCYYLVPIAPEGGKCCSGERSRRSSIGIYWKDNFKWLQFITDGFFAVLLITAFVAGAVGIDKTRQFESSFDPQLDYNSTLVEFFTLATFISTYTYAAANHDCISSSANPLPLLRAALAMIFLSLTLAIFVFQLSLKAYMKARRMALRALKHPSLRPLKTSMGVPTSFDV